MNDKHNPIATHLHDIDYRDMVENSLDLIIKVNLTGHYTYVNPAFCALYGTTPEALLGRHYADDVVEEDRTMVDEFMSKLFTPPYTVSFTHRENTVKSVRRLEWTGKGLTNAAGELVEFVGIARDVTDRLDLIDKLSQQANHDDLTGLANRRFLVQQASLELTRAIRYQYPLSLFMLDIDHFKRVNDHYGHLSGDLVLKQLSQEMKRFLREHDLIGRIGGEEFAVLLPETNLEAATVIAERLRQAVEKLTFKILHDKIIALSISIGVACSTEVEQDLEKLWHEADVRLYQAKSAGRNQVVTAKALSYPLFDHEHSA
jgi:diguanylate cyclase (GGDEF)-like protein/PAS domain S-box-containing protein